MQALSTYHPLLNDILSVVAPRLSPECAAKCRQVSRQWKKIFEEEQMWVSHLKKDYPHINCTAYSEKAKDLYYRLRSISFNCLKYNIEITEKSKMALGVFCLPLWEGHSDVYDTMSASFFVFASRWGVQVYTSHTEPRSFTVSTNMICHHPEIYLDRFLILSDFHRLELWDLKNKELVLSTKDNHIPIHFLRHLGEYLYYTHGNSIYFIPLLKDTIPKPPITISHAETLKLAYVENDNWYLFDESRCYIANLDGEIIKEFAVANKTSSCVSRGVSLHEADNHYLFEKKDEKFFQIIFKETGTNVRLPKTAGSSCLFCENKLFFIFDGRLFFYTSEELSNKEIGSINPHLYFDFQGKGQTMMGAKGDKVVLRYNSESLSAFLIFDIKSKTYTEIPCMQDKNYSFDLYENFIFFISYSQGVRANVILADARTGKLLKDLDCPGSFAGIYKNKELVFVDTNNMPSIKFSSYILGENKVENIENFEQCFEFVE